MKPRFIKTLTAIALVGLGITGLSGCGGNGIENDENISFETSWKQGEKILKNVSYTLKPIYKGKEDAKFTLTSNAPSAFESSRRADGTFDISFKANGDYTIVAALEEDATANSTLNVSVEEGKISYSLYADTEKMQNLYFDQGAPFNSAGLTVYKVTNANGIPTNSRRALSQDDYRIVVKGATPEEDIELVDGYTLKVAGEITATVIPNDSSLGEAEFTFTVLARPTYLADQFFAAMQDNYSVYLVTGQNGQELEIAPWLVRNENYIMSYDSILMGTAGLGFYKDGNKVRQFYVDQANSTNTTTKYIAGRTLHSDVGYGSKQEVVRGEVTDEQFGNALNYAKGYFKLKDGSDYNAQKFAKEGKPQMAGQETIFSFSPAAETTSFITGLLGITELLNYGFQITPQIAFLETELGVSSLVTIDIKIGQQQIGGSFLIQPGDSGDTTIDEFILGNPTPNLKSEKALSDAIAGIRGNNFMGSDETNFTDGFVDGTAPNGQLIKDGSYGIYYATNDAYMVSTGFRDNTSEQHTKKGVFTKLDPQTQTPVRYIYAAATKDGANGEYKEITGDDVEQIFNQYLPSNWPGFSTAEDKYAVVPGVNFEEQWLLQTLPSPVYEKGQDGKLTDKVIGYDYQFRLVGSASAILWSVVSGFAPQYAQLFVGESIILNVSTDTTGALTSMSIVLHGSVAEQYQSQMKTYSACNLLPINIDVNSFGKTKNPIFDAITIKTAQK